MGNSGSICSDKNAIKSYDINGRYVNKCVSVIKKSFL